MADAQTTIKQPLTPKSIEVARPREKEYELCDSAAPGLCLRVTPKGSKIFRWYVTSLGRVITIGRWAKTSREGYVTLGEARAWLERLKEAHRTGRLDEIKAELEEVTRSRKKTHPEPAGEGGPVTLNQVAAEFLKLIERRRKRPEEVRRTIEKEILPALGDRSIVTITPRDIRAIIEKVVERGSPTQAGKVLAHAKQLFRFACGRDDVPAGANPAYPLDADALGVENNVCQRYLSAEEIPGFWEALGKPGLTPTVRIALKVILLTGVRTCELLRARWDDVDLEKASWTIPLASQKLTKKQEQTARPWIVPLSPMVVGLFRELHVLAQGSPWVTASPHARPDEPSVPLTDKALVAGMRNLFAGKKPLLTFVGERPTPHDLRRTMRTHLGDKLGVPWHIAERCLNHSIGRITQTYDVGDYLAERRAALEKWTAYVERLVTPSESNVAFLRMGAEAVKA